MQISALTSHADCRPFLSVMVCQQTDLGTMSFRLDVPWESWAPPLNFDSSFFVSAQDLVLTTRKSSMAHWPKPPLRSGSICHGLGHGLKCRADQLKCLLHRPVHRCTRTDSRTARNRWSQKRVFQRMAVPQSEPPATFSNRGTLWMSCPCLHGPAQCPWAAQTM